MTFQDLVANSTGNLWRMKLRSFLTIAGIVIAIAAFVAMVSFGAGVQKNIKTQFDELGLFSMMHVYPPRTNGGADSIKTVILDDAALDQLAAIPGVGLVYPFDKFPVTVTIIDTQFNTNAQALPNAAVETPLFSRLQAGSIFSSDSAREAVVTDRFLEILGTENADSLIGRQLVISVKPASLDSALAHVFRDPDSSVRKRLAEVDIDSIFKVDFVYRKIGVRLDTLSGGALMRMIAGMALTAMSNDAFRQRLQSVDIDSLIYEDNIRQLGLQEFQSAMSRFLEGYLQARGEVSDTLTICGVIKGTRGRSRMEPILIPEATARRFNAAGLIGDPTSMFSSLSSGVLPQFSGDAGGRTYPRVTLELDPTRPIQPISDSVKALGFRTFSYAEEFKEIQKMMVYFNMALGAVGLIALFTAALGIVNTMVFSILERTREIGVLKSLGADDRDIRIMFLAESGMIGAFGAIFGIIFGWLITRAASIIARIIMVREGIDEMELFALPPWLVLTAFGFGLLISLIAGFYPASRAARIDPVQALRAE